ncbi:MAG: outer membrane protein assembly factor BamD [Alphaproteobacteria bacterium]|jgi:outer membrane protein assembly factor BamD|nr:outer membrane protein assembly factor BamD [Alphaproteobacteria bacterium]
MNKIKIAIILLLVSLLASCSSFEKEPSMDVDFLYANALYQFNNGNLFEAKKIFQQISDNFPYKDEAIEAQVFLIWIFYLENDYINAEVTIDAFLKYYVANKYTDWANYMKALMAYEQMDSAETDPSDTLTALNLFANIYKRFEGTRYAQDAYYRIEVIKYNLALRSTRIGFFYLQNRNYIAAIARYQDIVNNFSDTIFVQEAMYRLVYLWLILGVDDEAFRTAAVLGYNYPQSAWYARSLTLINRHLPNRAAELKRNTATH